MDIEESRIFSLVKDFYMENLSDANQLRNNSYFQKLYRNFFHFNMIFRTKLRIQFFRFDSELVQRDLKAISKLIAGLFVTYEDFVLYMRDHKEDFCYWIHESYFANDHLSMLDVPNTNLLTAMFFQQISNGTIWTAWEKVYSEESSSWFEGRRRISKGKDVNFSKNPRQNFISTK